MSNVSWEKQAIDEIIKAEKRFAELVAEVEAKEELWQVAKALGINTGKLAQAIDELYSELYDVENILENNEGETVVKEPKNQPDDNDKTIAKELKSSFPGEDEINSSAINFAFVWYYEPIMDGVCPLCGHFLDRSETEVDYALFEVVDICNNCGWRGETHYD